MYYIRRVKDKILIFLLQRSLKFRRMMRMCDLSPDLVREIFARVPITSLKQCDLLANYGMIYAKTGFLVK